MIPRSLLPVILVTTLLVACGPRGGGSDGGGAGDASDSGLAGRLTWKGEVPPPPIPDRIPRACGGRPDVALLELGPEGGIAGALVWVPEAEGPAAPTEVELKAARCAVSPKLAVAAEGALLRVSSDDDLVHTFHLRLHDEQGGERNVQTLAVPPGIDHLAWTLDQPGLLSVRSDHFDWMEAWLLVGRAGRWTITDAEGRFELPELPAGSWGVEIFHPVTGLDHQVITVPEDGPASLYRTYEPTGD
jgi:hypothetical protein